MVGIEIEGWWWDLIGMQEKARTMTGSPGVSDGSIRALSSCNGTDDGGDDDPDMEDCEEGCDDCPHPVERANAPRCEKGKSDCKACGARGWEFRSKPGSVGEALRQLTALYPDVTSRAAGMHVHMSFKEKTSISLLCSDKFFKYWQDRWEAWGTKNNVKGVFWERLRNENQYCRPTAMSDYGNDSNKKLVSANAGGRYKAINFQAFDQHGTVEFRLLPMFQKGNLSVLAVENLVDIVETFLQNYDFSGDIIPPAVKVSGDAILMEPVDLDFEVPAIQHPVVTAEVDLEDKCEMGEVKDSNGKPTGTIRLFRYQVANYMANASNDATDKMNKIADPKRNKVVWENFDPNPRGRV
jgi:hypothetical protein